MPGSIISGIFGMEAADTQASASRDAANTSAEAARYAADLQKQALDQARADQTPWREAGANALARMSAGTQRGGEFDTSAPFSFNAAGMYDDPGYQFRLSEGLKSLERSAAARGGLLSGGALKGISRYGQDYASGEYDKAFNRALTGYNSNQQNVSNSFNRLASIAGTGQTATNQLQAAGQNYAGNAGQYAMNAGGDAATAQLVGGMGRASAYQGIGNALGRVNWGALGSAGPTGGYMNGTYVPNLLDQQYAQGWGYGD